MKPDKVEQLFAKIIPLMHELSELSQQGELELWNWTLTYQFTHKFSEWSELPEDKQ